MNAFTYVTLLQLHFREQDVYTDTSGKIRKVNGAVPVFDDVQQLNLSDPCLADDNASKAIVSDDTETLDIEPEYQDVEYLDDENELDSTACAETTVNCSTTVMQCDEKTEHSVSRNCTNCITTME